MKIIQLIQMEEYEGKTYTLYSDIEKRLKDKKLKKAWIIAGIVKDEALLMLEESLNIAKENGVLLNFNLGIDRRTISEEVLKKLVDISDTIYAYNNNGDMSFNGKLYLFEYAKKVEILIPTTNLTASGILENYSNNTLIEFDLKEDTAEYNEFMFSIKEYIYPDLKKFITIDEKKLNELTLNRQLAISKTSDSKLPSISDYLKAKNTYSSIDEKEIEDKISEQIKNVVSNFDLQFDLEEEENVEVEKETKITKKTKK